MIGQRVRVLLADDHDIVRTGVRAILESHEGWRVCAEATNGEEAVRLAAEFRPDVAVVDLEMKELDGLAVTRRIKANQPLTEVLIFTMHDDESLIREVLLAGARGVVLKSEGGQPLVKAIECALQRKPYFAARASQLLLDHFRSDAKAPESSSLTAREREIVRLLADGKSNKEAAVVLGISVKTVETHRAAIMRKLGLRSIVSLVRYAVRERFIKP